VKVLCQCGPRLTCGAPSLRVRVCVRRARARASTQASARVYVRVHETRTHRMQVHISTTPLPPPPPPFPPPPPPPPPAPCLPSNNRDRIGIGTRAGSRALEEIPRRVRVMRVPRAIVIGRSREALSQPRVKFDFRSRLARKYRWSEFQRVNDRRAIRIMCDT